MKTLARRPPERGLSRAVQNDRLMKDLQAADAALDRASLVVDPAMKAQAFKAISDYAAAQELFAARQGLSETVLGKAHALRYESLSKLGGVLPDIPKAKRGAGPGRGKVGIAADPTFNQPPTLEELGISKRTANLARTLAALRPTELNAITSGDKTLAAVTREKAAKVRAKRMALPNAKYRVVYADPPWQYNDQADAGSVQAGGAAHKYPTMSIKELCALDVQGICDQDSVLFLWVTSPLLFECAPVITAWRFHYRASIVWNKDAHNMGHYVSVQHEFLLICTRGSATPDTKKRLPSVVTEKRGKHSVKPERFRQMIDEMYPAGRRIELFARTDVNGWDQYGNEGRVLRGPGRPE